MVLFVLYNLYGQRNNDTIETLKVSMNVCPSHSMEHGAMHSPDIKSSNDNQQ